MPLNPNIILSGQTPNFVNALAGGAQAAQSVNAVQDQNNLRKLYAEQGQQIAQGDPNALNALAGLNPQAALDAQQTQQSMRLSDAKFQLLKQEAARKARADAAKLSEEQRKQAIEGVKTALSALTPYYSKGDREGYNAALQQLGLDPQQYGFDNFESNAAQFEGVLETLQTFDERNAGPDPSDRYRNVGSNLVDLQSEGGPSVVDLGDAAIDPEMFKNVTTARKEFNGIPLVKDFQSQSQAMGRIVASAEDPSPAGDLALIFNYMKVLDPGSVVRESEFETAAQARAWLQRMGESGIPVPAPIAQAIRKAQTGNRLSTEQRADFVGRAQKLYDQAERGFTQVEQQYQEFGKRYGLPGEDVTVDYRYRRNVDDTTASRQPESSPQPVPDFSQMSDEELDAYIQENSQ